MPGTYYIDGEPAAPVEVRRVLRAANVWGCEETHAHMLRELATEGYVDADGIAVERVEADAWGKATHADLVANVCGELAQVSA